MLGNSQRFPATMSYPFKPANNQPFTFDGLIGQMRAVFKDLLDIRTGNNTHYTMVDAALGGFSVLLGSGLYYCIYGDPSL
jgi:hypothetical protein